MKGSPKKPSLQEMFGGKKAPQKVFGFIGLGHFPTIQMYPTSRFRSAGASITWCASEGYDNCSKTGDYLVRGGWGRMIHASFCLWGKMHVMEIIKG